MKWFADEARLCIAEWLIELGFRMMPNNHAHTRIWARHINAAATEIEPYVR